MSEREMWATKDGAILYNVHPASRCAGTPCWIHHPTDHHMLDWEMVRVFIPHLGWMMTRQCLHGEQHIDPDQRWFVEHILHVVWDETCDGCCTPPKEREDG